MGNSWDTSPLPEKGDENIEATYASVGYALSAWESLEERLAFLYVKFLNVKDGASFAAAMRAYGTISTFRGRKEMVEAAMHAFFHEEKTPIEDQEPIIEFIKLMDKHVLRRNEIAHGIVKSYTNAFIGEQRPLEGYVLCPHYHNPKKQKLNDFMFEPTFAYSSIEIKKYAEAFLEIDKSGQAAHQALRKIKNNTGSLNAEE